MLTRLIRFGTPTSAGYNAFLHGSGDGTTAAGRSGDAIAARAVSIGHTGGCLQTHSLFSVCAADCRARNAGKAEAAWIRAIALDPLYAIIVTGRAGSRLLYLALTFGGASFAHSACTATDDFAAVIDHLAAFPTTAGGDVIRTANALTRVAYFPAGTYTAADGFTTIVDHRAAFAAGAGSDVVWGAHGLWNTLAVTVTRFPRPAAALITARAGAAVGVKGAGAARLLTLALRRVSECLIPPQ